MFTVESRERLRDQLMSAASADDRISAAALVGSSALGREDEWSDIDLALCIDAEAERSAVIVEWTDWMYDEHAAVHHTDVARRRDALPGISARRHAPGRPLLLARDGVRPDRPTLPPAVRSRHEGNPGSGTH